MPYSHEREKIERSFFADLLAFDLASYERGWGFLFRFSDRGLEFCTEKLSRGWGW